MHKEKTISKTKINPIQKINQNQNQNQNQKQYQKSKQKLKELNQNYIYNENHNDNHSDNDNGNHNDNDNENHEENETQSRFDYSFFLSPIDRSNKNKSPIYDSNSLVENHSYNQNKNPEKNEKEINTLYEDMYSNNEYQNNQINQITPKFIEKKLNEFIGKDLLEFMDDNSSPKNKQTNNNNNQSELFRKKIYKKFSENSRNSKKSKNSNHNNNNNKNGNANNIYNNNNNKKNIKKYFSKDDFFIEINKRENLLLLKTNFININEIKIHKNKSWDSLNKKIENFNLELEKKKKKFCLKEHNKKKGKGKDIKNNYSNYNKKILEKENNLNNSISDYVEFNKEFSMSGQNKINFSYTTQKNNETICMKINETINLKNSFNENEDENEDEKDINNPINIINKNPNQNLILNNNIDITNKMMLPKSQSYSGNLMYLDYPFNLPYENSFTCNNNINTNNTHSNNMRNFNSIK
jgi:hypothetical protein